jgi:hypothetical protein
MYVPLLPFYLRLHVFDIDTCACTDEKNERSKQVIRAKLKDYIDRAEKLKAYLKGNEGKKPVAQGGGYLPSTKSFVFVMAS